MVSVQRFTHGFINDAVRRADLDVYVSSPFDKGDYRKPLAIEWAVTGHDSVGNADYGAGHDVQVLLEAVADDVLTASDLMDDVLEAVIALWKAGNYSNPHGILSRVEVESGTVYAIRDGKITKPSFVSTIRLIIR